jgi:hypothetical protein
MPELVQFEVHPQTIEGKVFPVLLYHKTQGTVSANSDEEVADALRKGFSRQYVHQEFPKAIYYPDGRMKIVRSRAEQDALPEKGSEQPFKKPLWDTRQPEPGFQINEHHLAFLRAHGYEEVKTVEEAKSWFNALPNSNAQFAFLEDATNWIPPEEKKRGPGRPPKAE